MAGRRHAGLLVELLGDDSPVVLAEVRSALARAGRSAAHALRKATGGADARQAARARLVLADFARERAWRRLCGLVSREPIDLERALLFLSAYLSPGLDLRVYRRALDALGRSLAERVHGMPPGIGRALTLGHHLGTELGFRGDHDDYHHPDNLSLARVIERKRGLPLTLCALYRSVARRAGLRAELLALPGHVLLCVDEGGARPILDPFDGGRTLAEADCRTYLARNGVPWSRKWLEPVGEQPIFLRQLANARRSAHERGWTREVRRLARLRGALETSLRARVRRVD